MAGTIVDPTVAATVLETQRLGYNGTTLTEFDSTLEPQIIGNFEIAGSIASFASLESITGWSGLSNGDVYIKIVPDTGAGTVAAEFTSTAPTWDNTKMGWYGTGANANHRYLFKLEKTGASGYENKINLNKNPLVFEVNQDLQKTDSPIFANINISESIVLDAVSTTEGAVYSAISPVLPNIGDKCLISGGLKDVLSTNNRVFNFSYAERTTSTTIVIYGLLMVISSGGAVLTYSAVSPYTATSGDATAVDAVSIATGHRI